MNLADLTQMVLRPIGFLGLWASILLIVDLWIPKDRKTITGWLTLLGLASTAIVVAYTTGEDPVAMGGMVKADGFAYMLYYIFLLVAALTVLLSMSYIEKNNIERGEFYSLILFATIGMMGMAMANDMIVVFVALEVLSIPLYVLAGYLRGKAESEESAMKYFLLGAFASAFLVYGIALVFGATGTTNLEAISAAIEGGAANRAYLYGGIGLILVGLGFKVATVPFHMWTPDVYEGAPSVVTAFFSVGAKAGGFAALLRVLYVAFEPVTADWAPVIAILSALTMIFGNISAITQTSIKRMLAYSSIAHAGYILMAGVAGGQGALTDFAASAAAFYLVGYAFTNMGTWGIVMAVEKEANTNNEIASFAGLGKKRPMLAMAMVVLMLSLTGLPPTIGFVGKFYIFTAAIDAGYMWLALVGVVTSLISAYYYLRVIIVMYMQDGDVEADLPWTLSLAVGLTTIATFVFGVIPQSLLNIGNDLISGIF